MSAIEAMPLRGIKLIVFNMSNPMRIPAVTPKLTQSPGGTRWLGPKLGEHTAEVLTALGYSEARQAELRVKQII